MNKIRASLACPKCKASGSDIELSKKDDYKKYEYEDITGFDIKRTYKCHCKKCGNYYEIDYGQAELRKYDPPICDTCVNDVFKYVSYESDFDRSYVIVDVNNVPMIIMDDDIYPIIIYRNEKDELINNHDKAKKLVNNIWMNRYR